MTDIRKAKELAKELKTISKYSEKERDEKIIEILNLLPEETVKNMFKKIGVAVDVVDEYKAKEQLEESENKVIKSIKEFVGELFPSLSFYPALGIWGMMDKIIQSDKGFDVLTPEQCKLLAAYTGLFFGMVGGKIAYNRLKELANKTKNKPNKPNNTESFDNQINEVLRLAGVKNV